MKIKLFENYFQQNESNKTINNPNFSIVVPGGCNGKCDFCFWQKTKPCGGYINKLSETLNNLPTQFHQISLTGGEPTISPYLNNILETIDRSRFEHVVMTTNGTKLLEVIPILEGVVDHINISRHHYDENLNNSVFKAEMISNRKLKHVINELNKIGIDVTLSAVLNENLNTKKQISEYLNFAKSVGASQVFFRKPHGNLEPTGIEKTYENYKSSEFSCPVCRTKNQLIEGMRVSWKASLEEPSSAMEKIYELIFHENGSITKDWEGNLNVNVKEILENSQLLNEKLFGNINESCGYGFTSSCGGFSSSDNTYRVKAKAKAAHPYNPTNTKEGMLKALYDYYVGSETLKIGDKVIYNNDGSKHDGKTFTYEGIREDDGKFKLRLNNIILYASPNRVTKIQGDNAERIEKFKKVIKAMIENGDLKQSDLDSFLGKKINDPFDEEDWG